MHELSQARDLELAFGLLGRGALSNQKVLRVLRSPVYLGKIAHGDDLHEGKHEAIVDEGVFAGAQKLLDERAAESTTIRPTTSGIA
jgi:Recombinase